MTRAWLVPRFAGRRSAAANSARPLRVGGFEGSDVAGLAAELDTDEMYGGAGGAVLVGAAALPQLGEGGTGRRHLGDLELEQVDVAGGADRHVQTRRST